MMFEIKYTYPLPPHFHHLQSWDGNNGFGGEDNCWYNYDHVGLL